MSYVVSVDDLCKEFKGNTLAAEQKYKDSMIAVVGVVDSVGKRPAVDLKTMNSQERYYVRLKVSPGAVTGLPPIVRYCLDPDQIEDASELSSGDTVFIEATIKEFGTMNFDLEGGGYVIRKLTEKDLAGDAPAS